MSDVNCPYCKEEIEINHDDGYGFEEDRGHEQECNQCGKYFIFFTSISYDYRILCQPQDHDMESKSKEFSKLSECKNCDHYEMKKL